MDSSVRSVCDAVPCLLYNPSVCNRRPVGASNLVTDIPTDRELLERIQAGDKSACAECVDLHAPRLYRLALRLVGSPPEAEDVVQETFLSAFKAIHTFQGRSSLSTWLYRIAYNAALMRLRRARPETVSVDVPQLDGGDGLEVPRQLFDWCCLPEPELDSQEARQELEHAIRALAEKLRAVVVLRELERLSNEANGETLDLVAEAVKTAWTGAAVGP